MTCRPSLVYGDRMIARILSLQLKPNATAAFVDLFEKTVLPTLREQKGFKDEMLFVLPGGPEVVAVSFWESRKHAEAYDRGTYPQLLMALADVIEGAPVVGAFHLAYSTSHETGPAAFAHQPTTTTGASAVG